MNIELLKQVRDHILEEPLRFDMRDGIQGVESALNALVHRFNEQGNYESREFPACGTVACIAGWAAILAGQLKPRKNCAWDIVRFAAIEALDGDDFRHSWNSLFYNDEWPEPFRSQYRAAANPQERAQVAAARIDHLIETGN